MQLQLRHIIEPMLVVEWRMVRLNPEPMFDYIITRFRAWRDITGIIDPELHSDLDCLIKILESDRYVPTLRVVK